MKKAIIVDIDGTLALRGERSPYDWDKVGEDLPNRHIVDLVKNYSKLGYIVIICTGRDGGCEPQTRNWLCDNDIPFDEFYMRPEGNNESDSIVKGRMCDEIVKKYEIEFVLDDRDSVVKMWRERGLPCLQVNYGDF